MRKKYHMPKVFIEEFSANAAVATSSCTSTTGYSYTFDCMAGPNADNGKNVVATALSSGCTNNVSWFADYQTAVDLSKSSSGQHSNHNGGTWGCRWPFVCYIFRCKRIVSF